jgi:hypothetical protein
MRNLLFIVFFAGSAICASAQKTYFIYLQSENNSTFYVKMDDKIYSSATSGYLILSNLIDSTYNFSIGFPISQSESRFVVTMNARDRGFLIKKFESGPGLFDLQNLSIINPQKDESKKGLSYQKREDAFSYLLSKAANDTSLLYVMERPKEDVAIQKDLQKTDEAIRLRDTTGASSQEDLAPVKKQDTIAVTSINTQKGSGVVTPYSNEYFRRDSTTFTAPKEQSITVGTTTNVSPDTPPLRKDSVIISDNAPVETAVFKKSKVKKHSESSTTEGFGLVFYDSYDEGQDTIRLLIPNPPIVFKQTAEEDSSLQQNNFIHVDELKHDTVPQTSIVSTQNNLPEKSPCKTVASDNDFFKLRKNMAAETTDEEMVAVAKKIFRSKCFTTGQVKNLSTLFLTSAGKYQFFDAAYLHVSDQEQFSSLESEIKDEYYLRRFKALVGK